MVRHRAHYGKRVWLLPGAGENRQRLRRLSLILEYCAFLPLSGPNGPLAQSRHSRISRGDGIRSHSLYLSDPDDLPQALHIDIWLSVGLRTDYQFAPAESSLDNSRRLAFPIVSTPLSCAVYRSPSARSSRRLNELVVAPLP